MSILYGPYFGHTMKTPKTVAATKFKAHCLTLLEEVRQTRQTLLVTRHGKPVAEISPYTPKTEQLNPLKGSVLFEGDIISPLEEKWDCEQ
jgi:prevent-host-death family protein